MDTVKLYKQKHIDDINTKLTTDYFTKSEVVDVVNQSTTSSLTIRGYISTIEPSNTSDLKVGEYWYNPGTAVEIPALNFPWSVKTWDGTVWSTATTDITPAYFDTYVNLDNHKRYYYSGAEWNELDFGGHNFNTSTFKIVSNTVDIKENGVTNAMLGGGIDYNKLTNIPTETDPVYSADKPLIALKSEVSGLESTLNTNITNAETAAKTYTDNAVGNLNILPDAPSDGKLYARKSNAWEEVVAGTTGVVSNETDPIYTADKQNIVYKADLNTTLADYAKSSGGTVTGDIILPATADIATANTAKAASIADVNALIADARSDRDVDISQLEGQISQGVTNVQIQTGDNNGTIKYRFATAGAGFTMDPQEVPVNLTGYSTTTQTDAKYATIEQGAKADTAYQKPASGIPATDLASAVQTSISSSYVKPTDGIPLSDLTQAVQDRINSPSNDTLRIPKKIDLESLLPTIGKDGDYYIISNMDVTSPGQSGEAWWDSAVSTTSWSKVSDTETRVDGSSIVETNRTASVSSEWVNTTVSTQIDNDVAAHDANSEAHKILFSNKMDYAAMGENGRIAAIDASGQVVDSNIKVENIVTTADQTSAINAALVTYPTRSDMDSAIAAAKSGVFTPGGSYADVASFPTTAADYTTVHSIADGNTYYASNKDGALSWIKFSNIDLSQYSKTTDINTGIEHSLNSAKSYTDSKLTDKVDVTGTAANSSRLNGKFDTEFATSAQGAKADANTKALEENNTISKANTAIQNEVDPTVPAWAKQASKPIYTAIEVGAATTEQGAKADSAYQKASTGIPLADLSDGVKTSLGKADTALQTETDPTVPAWAKQVNKPSYTASEVGALGTNSNYAASTSVAGSAVSADKLLNKLTINANNVTLDSFDGSSAKTVNITASNVGAATAAQGVRADNSVQKPSGTVTKDNIMVFDGNGNAVDSGKKMSDIAASSSIPLAGSNVSYMNFINQNLGNRTSLGFVNTTPIYYIMKKVASGTLAAVDSVGCMGRLFFTGTTYGNASITDVVFMRSQGNYINKATVVSGAGQNGFQGLCIVEPIFVKDSSNAEYMTFRITNSNSDGNIAFSGYSLGKLVETNPIEVLQSGDFNSKYTILQDCNPKGEDDYITPGYEQLTGKYWLKSDGVTRRRIFRATFRANLGTGSGNVREKTYVTLNNIDNFFGFDNTLSFIQGGDGTFYPINYMDTGYLAINTKAGKSGNTLTITTKINVLDGNTYPWDLIGSTNNALVSIYYTKTNDVF